MQDKEVTRAGFGPRAAAYIIDRAILFAALLIVRAPFRLAALLGAGRLTAKSFLFSYSFLDVLCWVLAAAYFVLLTYFTGGTLGKKVLRLRVEREDGESLRLIDVLYRETVGRFLSGILCIGYLMVLADEKKRAFHDYLCDTRVVYEQVVFRTREKDAPAVPGWTPAAELTAPAAEEASGEDAPGTVLPTWSQPDRTSAPVEEPEALSPAETEEKEA